MSYQLTINGVTKTLQPGWAVSSSANGKDQFSFSLISLDGSYRVGLDDEIFLYENGVKIFGGLVTTPTESGLAGLGVQPIETSVTAVDFNSLADREYITSIIPSGSLKAAMNTLVAYLPTAFVHAAQVTGPTLPDLTYSDVKAIDVLNDLTIQSGGYLWTIDYDRAFRMSLPGTVAAPANVLVPNCIAVGDIQVTPTRVGYANRIIVKNKTLRSLADSASEQATHGLWMALYTAPDTLTQPALDALAAQILARSIIIFKEVKYSTYTAGLLPGQTQTITIPWRNLNNTFLITQVKSRAVGNLVIRDVTATEGIVYQTGWRETWRAIVSGGGLTVGGGGAGSGSTVTRYAYFLGGTGVDATRSPTPTWVPAHGGNQTLGQGALQVQINTVPRGTLAAVVTVRLRSLDAGVSVQARLYDSTNNSPCPGLSAVVTSQTWVTTVFTATLTAGSHLYELQLLPGASNADVLGTGYVE